MKEKHVIGACTQMLVEGSIFQLTCRAVPQRRSRRAELCTVFYSFLLRHSSRRGRNLSAFIL